MTLPRDLSIELGESEMSHGGGMFAHPDSDFQKNRTPFPQEADIDDDYRDTVAIRRSDSTVGDETTRDLMFEKGNPDRFGAQPALVRVPKNSAPREFPTVTPKTRVEREE